MAPIYRLPLFAVPLINCFFLIASLHSNYPNAETWSYISYVLAPFDTICVAMHSMSRPKRLKRLKEEFCMLFIGVLFPLILTLAVGIKFSGVRRAPSTSPL